jgi:hypothetical protein
MKLTLVLTASLLASACASDSKPAEPAAAPPSATPAPPAPTAAAAAPPPPAAAPLAPPEPDDPDPRINAIRARYRAIEAAVAAAPTRKLERTCKGETALSAQLFEGEGLQKAVVSFHPAGDTSDIYNLYFDQGQPVFVLYSELGFEGGGTTLTEERYYIADRKPMRCLSKSAAGVAGEDLSELQIAERIQQAANKEGDCKRAKRALAIAKVLTTEKADEAILTKLCGL